MDKEPIRRLHRDGTACHQRSRQLQQTEEGWRRPNTEWTVTPDVDRVGTLQGR